MDTVDIAIIGAGPYGLSAAAHLLAQGAEVRAFGFPMQTWREAMPAGMFLKSEPFASSLSDPEAELPLEKFYAACGLPYAATGKPVPLSAFIRYGEEFQQRFVPDLDRQMVVSVETGSAGFNLRTEHGESVRAKRVVVASGIRSFAYTPPELRSLPPALASHSAQFGDAGHLAGKDVLVVGAGSSATDIAVLLLKSGARVSLITRRESIRFQSPLGERTLSEKVKAPMTGLGPGWKSVLCVKAPLLFHCMPESFRLDVVRRYLGPAPAWFTKSALEGRIEHVLGVRLLRAEAQNGQAQLTLANGNGDELKVTGDHVVAATGYRVDIDRLYFLSDGIRGRLRRSGGAPALSWNFESSIPNLYFIGTSAANCFGPMLRFVYGTNYAAKRLANHLAPKNTRAKAISPNATAEEAS
jgi:pyruvate/2-oxoglutarate dehydrogenase complex dihydrolipoamide dehydrogenase (E3) component